MARLRKEAADFPARLQREVQQATAQAAKEAKQQAEQQALLLKTASESDRRVAELQIKTLEDMVSRQNAQLADMQKQMDDAKKQVQEVAVRAIEGASGAKTLAHVNEIAMEQAKREKIGWQAEAPAHSIANPCVPTWGRRFRLPTPRSE